MAIVMGLDQHRAQITADWLDTETGEVSRRRISPAHRAGVRRFCQEFGGQQLEVALEATTGWRFVAEEFRRAGAVVHLAEPAETAARRGNKKRAKSDRADARHVRELLMIGRLPESWIPTDHILDLRARVRLRHTLSHQRGEWQQRIQAVLGDTRRFSSSRDAVRYAGLDITVHQSDQRRAAGQLSRQGPPALRWALFEATMCAARADSPDHEYYAQAAERLGSNRARLSVARKLLKRSYHLLRELGEEALAPA